MSRLRQVSEILVEVGKNYDMLEMRKKNSKKDEDKKKIETDILKLKGQILYLLTATKKLVEQEDV
jgi:hypothetical protein